MNTRLSWFRPLLTCGKRSVSKTPTIRKPEAFAAAVEYYVNSISLNGASVSQAKLAKKYGVSASTISSRYKEIEGALTDEAERFAAALTS